MTKCIFFILFALPCFAFAKMQKYSDLQIMDYDEMTKLVRTQLDKAKAQAAESEDATQDREAVETLREALKIIFSRPNSDNMIAKLLPEVRKELTGYSAFEDTLASLVGEAISGISNEKLPTDYKTTYLFMLENILEEIKPDIGEREDYRKIFERVRDANIKVPKDVVKERRSRSMYRVTNPSESARKVLATVKSKTKSAD